MEATEDDEMKKLSISLCFSLLFETIGDTSTL